MNERAESLSRVIASFIVEDFEDETELRVD
jgi:hypothetical protein